MQWLSALLAAVLVVGCGDNSNKNPKDVRKQDPVKQNAEKKSGINDKSAPVPAPVDLPRAALPQASGSQALSSNDEDSDSNDEMDAEEIELFRREYDNARNLDAKIEAMIGLIQADEANALSILQDAYQSPEAKMRREVVLQLQDFVDDAQAVDLLLKALDDSDSQVVMGALEGLSSVDDANAQAAIAETARVHPDKSVREAATDYVDQPESD